MQRIYYLLLFFLVSTYSFSQDWTWVKGSNTVNAAGVYGTQGIPSATNTPGAREGSTTWTDNNGNLWLFGGRNNSNNYLGDLWRFNQLTNEWTWVKGSNLPNSTAIYGSQNVSSINNLPGSRMNAVSWVDNNNNLWLFGGDGYNSTSVGKLGDLWKYNITTNQWTWMKGLSTLNFTGVYGTINVASSSNYPGARTNSMSWIYGNKLYLFGGDGFGVAAGFIGDLWSYDLISNNWTWLKGSNSPSQLPIYGSLGVENVNNVPGARAGSATWNTSNGFLYLFGGTFGSNNFSSDVWRFNISTNQWAWIKGPSTMNNVGIYGTINIPSVSNNPGSRFKSVGNWVAGGNLYLFGGYGYSATNSLGYLNDLWKLDLLTLQWTYLKGTNSNNQVGQYGTMGITLSTNRPGAREYHSSWPDNSGNFWMIGGWGYANSITFGKMNDLWKYTVACPSMTSANSSTICSGSPLNFQLTANGTSTFTWQATPNSNVTGETTTITNGSSITDLLINTTNIPQNVVYTVTPISASGCNGTPQTVTITVNPKPIVTSPSTSSICTGQNTNFILSATISSTFVWQATPNANVTGETTSSTTGPMINDALTNTTNTPQNVVYNIIPTSAAGCIGNVQTLTVTVNPNPSMTNVPMATLCSGSTYNVTLTATVPSTFTWQAASNPNITGETTTLTVGNVINNTLINTSSTAQNVNYYITPTSLSGCVGQFQMITVAVYPSPSVNAGPDQSICAGSQVLLSASGANSYTWTNGVVNNVPFIPSATNVYTVTGTNSIGCTATDQVVVTVLPLPSINAGPDQTVCNGNSVTLNATGGFSLTWNNGVINGVPFTPSPGINTYTVIGTGSNGCSNSDFVIITVNPSGTINAGPDITICPGDSVTLYVPIDTTTITTFYTTSGTYIADFSSQPYGNSIQVSGMPAGSVISSPGDLSQICMDVEHSFLGDLDIWVQCPNGQIAPLVNAYTQGTGGFLPGGVSGGSVFLGDPIDDITGPPGTGWQYCFSSTNNTTGLFTSNIFNTIPVSIASGNNANGFSMDPNPVYYPEASFSNLIGCPVNGTWTILIQDEWQVDDGYLFNWSLNFTNSLNPGALVSAQWSNGVSNGIPFTPGTSGTYTVTGTTANGCIVTDQVNVTVLPLSSCISGGGFIDVNTMLPFSQDNFVATVIDHNNDGIDDVFGHILSQTNSNKLWINNGNSTFTDISLSTNFPVRNSARVIDLDKNGWSDIYYIVGDSVLVHYNMNGTYQGAAGNCAAFSISSLFGISISSIKQVQFADFNNDGIYDLLVQVQNGNQSQLRALKGQLGCQQGCPFTLTNPVDVLLTVNTLNYVETKFADLDNDFDMDILLSYAVSQYQNATYQMYRNDGSGLFTQLTGTGYQIGRSNAFGTVGELNNDGIPDIISGAADCCVQGDPLYQHLSSGIFNYTVSTSAIPRFLDPYYGKASLVDLNLDSKKDIVWVDLAAIGSSALQYHVNNGNGTFTESAASYNIDEGPTTGQCCPIKNFMHAVIIDINNDKKPDLDIHELDNVAPYTFVNNWTKYNNSNLNVVKLKLEACVGLREGWGSRLSYKTGGQWHHQQHTANTQDNYPFLYLGMGSNTLIDSLIVYWVGGNTTTLTNISSNQYLALNETPFCSFSQVNAQIIPNTPQIICSNQSIMLTADVQNVNTLQWFLNGQSITGATGLTYLADSSGNYSFIADNGSLCNISSDTVLVSVLPAPDVLIDPISNDTLCNTECAFLIASGAQQYNWFNGTSLYYTEVHNSGNYYVIGTNQNGCQDTAYIQMTYYPSTDTTLYVSAVNSYLLNGITYVSSGVYEQVLTNQYGCDSTITLDLDLSFAGIEENNTFIELYPNPAKEVLHINSSLALKSNYEILDVRGRVVARNRMDGNKTLIDVSKLTPGYYTIQFDESNIKLKFIKD